MSVPVSVCIGGKVMHRQQRPSCRTLWSHTQWKAGACRSHTRVSKSQSVRNSCSRRRSILNGTPNPSPQCQWLFHLTFNLLYNYRLLVTVILAIWHKRPHWVSQCLYITFWKCTLPVKWLDTYSKKCFSFLVLSTILE